MHLCCYKVSVNNNKQSGKRLSTITLTTLTSHIYCNNNITTTTATHIYKAYIKFGKSASLAKSTRTRTNTHKNYISYVQ